MPPILGTYIDGKIVPDTPPRWPNGERVVIEPAPTVPIKMMTEEDQGSDPESIGRWMTLSDSIPLATSSPLDDPEVIAWREKMREFNLEAVRKQMQELPE